jgi:hypothetical protein
VLGPPAGLPPGSPPSSQPGSIDALRGVLEADTPDCERPVVWTNAAEHWPSEPIAAPRRPGQH